MDEKLPKFGKIEQETSKFLEYRMKNPPEFWKTGKKPFKLILTCVEKPLFVRTPQNASRFSELTVKNPFS